MLNSITTSLPTMDPNLLLTGLILVAAFLYSSVGHAGASGYLAAMAFVGMSGVMMKPTALILNIVVASIALAQFYRAGQFSWGLFWPFALASMPCAYLGGMLPGAWSGYRPLVGIILAVSAAKLLWDSIKTPVLAAESEKVEPRRPPLWAALLWGAAIGLVSGLTGTGGGIFLSPLLLFMAWGTTRQSGGVAAAFILCNSMTGLLGNAPNLHSLSPWMPIWIGAVVVAGTVGAYLGSRRTTPPIFMRLLSIVLFIAAGKLILT